MSTPMWDIPEHFPITVNAEGHGPVDDSDPTAAGVNCWCKFRQPWPCPDDPDAIFQNPKTTNLLACYSVDMEDYEQVYEDFWKELVANPDGTLNVDAVKRELFDWYFAMGEVAEVYCHITDGALSKPNYYASGVISVADEYVDRLIAEALEDAQDSGG